MTSPSGDVYVKDSLNGDLDGHIGNLTDKQSQMVFRYVEGVAYCASLGSLSSAVIQWNTPAYSTKEVFDLWFRANGYECDPKTGKPKPKPKPKPRPRPGGGPRGGGSPSSCPLYNPDEDDIPAEITGWTRFDPRPDDCPAKQAHCDLAALYPVVQGFLEGSIGLLADVLSAFPGVGEVRDAHETISGEDAVSGDPLSTLQRSIGAIAVVVPVLSAAHLRKLLAILEKLLKELKKLPSCKNVDDLVDLCERVIKNVKKKLGISGRITRTEEVLDQGGNIVIRKYVKNQEDLLEEAFDRMGRNANDWIERKPGFFRSPDGKMEIEISTGHPHMGEGPHVKIMEFDPKKGKKGGMRVVEKIFVEDCT